MAGLSHSNGYYFSIFAKQILDQKTLNYMRPYFTAFLLLLATVSLSAQEITGDWCGLHHQEGAQDALRERRNAHKETLAQGIVYPRDILYVPITFHLVAETSGTGRITENRVLDQLCEINEDFAPYDIQFFLKDGQFNYVDNSTVFENHEATIGTIMTFQKVDRSLNVWIVESVDDPEDENPGETLAYYSPYDFFPFKDWIVAAKDRIGGNGIILTHELGHFFSLDHPFLGWEADPFGNEADEIGVPAPTDSANPGNNPTELMDGTNCENAADGICDTPPDYNNGLGNPGCTFTGNVLDPNGVPIDPDEFNYVSYFLNCPDESYHFTPQQNDLIQIDINSNHRAYLFQDPVPTVATIDEAAELIYPITGETVDGFNSVNLQWTSVPNATAYVLEISRVSTFTIQTIRTVVYGNSKVMDELDANRTYYWRVRPFNAHYGCADVGSEIESFVTGGTTTTVEPAYVLDWSVAPNPARSNAAVQLQVLTNEAFSGQLGLYDLNGKLVQQIRQVEFTTGENQISVPTTNLPNGIYVLQVRTDVGQLTEKVIIGN